MTLSSPLDVAIALLTKSKRRMPVMISYSAASAFKAAIDLHPHKCSNATATNATGWSILTNERKSRCFSAISPPEEHCW